MFVALLLRGLSGRARWQRAEGVARPALVPLIGLVLPDALARPAGRWRGRALVFWVIYGSC